MSKLRNMNFRERWILITGASSGLGLEMARQLALEQGARLILVARRQERLIAIKEELLELGAPRVEILVADLTDLEAVQTMWQFATNIASIYGVIANAGATHFGHFDELKWSDFQRLVALNVEGSSWLIQEACRYLEKQRESGGVLVISSLAGLNPIAYQSAYSATKAFLVHLGCSLHLEMRPRGVGVSVFCPGGIATEMTAGARFNDLRNWLVPVGPCARSALKGFKARRYVIVPGLIYQIGQWLKRVLPTGFMDRQIAKQYKSSLEKNA